MNFQNCAEKPHLTKASYDAEFKEQKPVLSFPISLLENLIPQQPEPTKKSVRRPA